MKRAVITGLGFITSIGNSRAEVTASLRAARTGVERFSEFDEPGIPVKLAGTVKGFEFPSAEFEDWTYPDRQGHVLPRETLRPMTPNALYAYFAMREAIADAGLPPEMVSNEDTGLTCASGGSMWMAYNNLHTMVTRGVQRVQPMAIINSIPGFALHQSGARVQDQGAVAGHVERVLVILARAGRRRSTSSVWGGRRRCSSSGRRIATSSRSCRLPACGRSACRPTRRSPRALLT